MKINIRFQADPTTFVVGNIYIMKNDTSIPYIAARATGKEMCLVSLLTGQIYYNQSVDKYIDVTSRVEITEI